jgi:hypothetical protein
MEPGEAGGDMQRVSSVIRLTDQALFCHCTEKGGDSGKMLFDRRSISPGGNAYWGRDNDMYDMRHVLYQVSS